MQFGKRVGEGTTEAISRFTGVGVANDLQAISDRIYRALAKLDEGSYGTCDHCGNQIAAGRLRAAPESALCIECARKGR
jgi:DnaK suppressor protein